MSSYGFGGRLTAAFPSQINVDPTELCNLACTHCPHPAFKASPHYAGRTLDPALNRKLVDEVATDGRGVAQHIRYSSEGEPLLHTGIFDMVADAVARSGATVSLTTNGTLLNDQRARRLLDTGVHLVDISIDAVDADTYARIRVRGDLGVTRANVRRLIALRRQRAALTRVVVSFIEQPQNAAERDAFVAYWRSQGVDDVVVRRQHSAGGSVIPVAALLRGRATAAPRRPCLYPWERIVLTPRGELAFCPQDWEHASAIADFRTTSIAAAWQSAPYRALRHAHLTDEFAEHPFCGRCPDWAQTRWPFEGRSYADLTREVAARGAA
ncbi:MAG: radical SAM protein [Acidobacteriota bacterium]